MSLFIVNDPVPVPAPQPAPAPAPAPVPVPVPADNSGTLMWMLIIGGLLWFALGTHTPGPGGGCSLPIGPATKAPFVTTLPVAAGIFFDGTPSGIQKMDKEHKGVLKIYEDFVATHKGEYRLLDINSTAVPDDDQWVKDVWTTNIADAKTKAPIVVIATPTTGVGPVALPALPDDATKQLNSLGVK